MVRPKIGVKCFPDNIEERLRLSGVEYIEVQVMPKHQTKAYSSPKTNIDDLMQYKGKILAVHAAHLDHEINPANPYRSKKNEYAMRLAKEAAKKLGAKYIIFHPGSQEPGAQERCSTKEPKNFFLQQTNDRVEIENRLIGLLRFNGGYKNNGKDIEELVRTLDATPEILLENVPMLMTKDGHIQLWPYGEAKDIQRFGNSCRARSCLDIGHAGLNQYIQYIANHDKGPLDLDKSILKWIDILNPPYFHICNISEKFEDHLNLDHGLINIPKIVQKLKDKDVCLTIEIDNPKQSDVDLVRKALD